MIYTHLETISCWQIKTWRWYNDWISPRLVVVGLCALGLSLVQPWLVSGAYSLWQELETENMTLDQVPIAVAVFSFVKNAEWVNHFSACSPFLIVQTSRKVKLGHMWINDDLDDIKCARARSEFSAMRCMTAWPSLIQDSIIFKRHINPETPNSAKIKLWNNFCDHSQSQQETFGKSWLTVEGMKLTASSTILPGRSKRRRPLALQNRPLVCLLSLMFVCKHNSRSIVFQHTHTPS